MMNVRNIITITLLTSALSACGSDSKKTVVPPVPDPIVVPDPTPDPTVVDLGITAVPDSLKSEFTAALKFDRYTKIDAPNGSAIHIIAQNEVTTNQIVRARNILQHFLTDYPGSEYGADKSAVANKIAENGSKLLLLNGVDDGTNAGAELSGQPLYYGEMQVEGGSWYINQNYEHRDASYEEILHFVHDNGIGVDGNGEFKGVLPGYQAEIRAAQINADSNQLWAWAAELGDWKAELAAENSLTQEYLASVIDTHYGLWGASNTPYGMMGAYVAKYRDDLLPKDPQAAALMDNKFFHPYLTYNARIDESFVGNFSLGFNAALPYTHHAQYLKDITLTGTESSGVIVNQLDNNITGNSASNTVFFTGPETEYTVTIEGDTQIVADMTDNRDGRNTLTGIETLQFATSEETEKRARFSYISEKTDSVIAVYGSKNSTKASYIRVYRDIKAVMDKMDADIKQGILNSDAKILVVNNEAELENDIEFFGSLIPVEAIYTNNDGNDESLTYENQGGVASSKLEFMYLSVYYALLTDDSLAAKFQELQTAYQEASENGYFTPGEAYVDGYVDEIHQNASDQNALKYGSYLFNLYQLYFGNGMQAPGEFTFTTKAELLSNNPLGHAFVQSYFDL